MKWPVEFVLAVLCGASLYRPFTIDMTMLEIIGYVSVALLCASLILVLHLKPNDVVEPIPDSLKIRPRQNVFSQKTN